MSEKNLGTMFLSENKMNKKILPIFALFLVLVACITSVSALGDTIFVDDYEIQYTYHSAEEGEKFSLTVSVTADTAKEDVVFEIRDDDPFDVDDDEWDIGDLAEGQTVSNTFRVEIDEGTAEGEYDLEFTLEDSDDDFEDEMEIEVSSEKPDLIVGSVSSVPLTLSPDQEDTKLEITIENIGGGDANFVRAKLILPEGFTASSSYSDSVSLGTISSKSNKVATFFIDVDEDIESGIHKARIQLDYKEKIDEKTQFLDIDLPIKGKPQFEVVSYRTSPSKILTGSSGTLSITIKNSGEEEGSETSVRVFENSDHPFEFDEKTNFVGNLEPGETGTAVFKLEADADGNPNKYLVRVQVRTLQNSNVLVEEHTVPVTIAQGQEGLSGYLILVIALIVILIIIYIIYRLLKPKKKR